MELQAEAERKKRGHIVTSEGKKESMINVAKGYKESKILEGQGIAFKIKQEARSVTETLDSLGKSIQASGEK